MFALSIDVPFQLVKVCEYPSACVETSETVALAQSRRYALCVHIAMQFRVYFVNSPSSLQLCRQQNAVVKGNLPIPIESELWV